MNRKTLLITNKISIKKFNIHLSVYVLLLVFVTSLSAQDQNRALKKTAFERGKLAYEQAKFEEAIRWFNESINSNDDYSSYENALYLLYRSKLARDSTAVGVLVQDFVNQSSSRQYMKLAYVDWAEYELRRNDRASYKKHLSSAIKVSGIAKEQANWMLLLAQNESAQNNMVEAHAYLDSTALKYSSTEWAPEALYQAARWHLQAQQYAEAAVDFESLRKFYPRHPHSQSIGIRLGSSYYKSEAFEQAILEFQKILPLLDGINEGQAVYMVAESYNILGDFDNASKWYLRYQRIMDEAGLDSRDADYGLGWVYMKQQIYHWAVEAFQKASDGDDLLAQKATYYQAVNEKLSGRYVDALSTFEQFFNRFSDGIWAERIAYEWAITSFEMGDFTGAIQILLPLARKADELNDPARILTFLGEAFFANGEYSSALQAFDEAAKNGKLNPQVRRQAVFQKGWVLYRNQAYNEARQNFEDVYQQVEVDTLGAEALFWSADCSFQLQEFERSAPEFKRFIEQYPDHEFIGAATYSLGWSYFMRGEFEPATEYLARFLERYDAPPIALFPYDTDTQLRLGDAWFALGKYENAETYYKKAIGAEPGGDYAMYQIANCYYRSEQTAKAIDEFAKLLRIYPYTQFREQARFNIGYLWFLNEQYDLAIQEYNKLIQMVPNSKWAARAQYSIGDAYFNAGDFDASINAYQQVFTDYPRSDFIIEAATGIQNAQLASGQEDTSNELLQDFIQKNPRASTLDALRYRKAESLYLSGDYESAVGSFTQYLMISSKEDLKDDALFYIAESERFIGNTEESNRRFNELIQRYPRSERSATALAVLAKDEYDAQRYDESLQYFEKLEIMGEKYQQDAWLGQAEAFTMLAKDEQANQLYERVLTKRANQPRALAGIGIIALRSGDYVKADSLLDNVSKTDLTEIGAKSLYYLALSKDRQDQREEAYRLLANVNVLFGIYEEWVTRSGLTLIEWYLMDNKKGLAAETLTELKKVYPNSIYTIEAEKRINQ